MLTFFYTAIDCGVLRNPVNGRVQLPRTVVGSQAVYSCDMGFVLIGDDTRTCGLDGQWSGSQPSCNPSGEIKFARMHE